MVLEELIRQEKEYKEIIDSPDLSEYAKDEIRKRLDALKQEIVIAKEDETQHATDREITEKIAQVRGENPDDVKLEKHPSASRCFCGKCGHGISLDWKICPYCGKELKNYDPGSEGEAGKEPEKKPEEGVEIAKRGFDEPVQDTVGKRVVPLLCVCLILMTCACVMLCTVISGMKFIAKNTVTPKLSAPATIEEEHEDTFPSYGRPTLGIMGSSMRDMEMRAFDEDRQPINYGVYVSEVIPGSAAAKAGIIPGMIITELDGIKTIDTAGLKSTLENYKAGDAVSLTAYIHELNRDYRSENDIYECEKLLIANVVLDGATGKEE